MEYNFLKHSVGCQNRFLDTVNEQIVDVDITLPDYCPDIEKILKCTLIPKIYTRSISGGQLTVDGESLVRILYCDSLKHNVRVYTQTVPFTANFNLKSTPEQYIIMCDTKCEYINCRALSPRKLVIHGAFSLSAKVISKELCGYYSFDEDSDLIVKEKYIEVSDLCALCQEQFSVSEDITISNKPPVESLLTYDVSADITDLKSIQNKIMLNAEITLKAMYLSDLESGNIEHFSYAFPISRVIDCENITDETMNVPTLEVMSCDFRIRHDQLNDGSMLNLDVKLCFSDLGYAPKKLSVVDDAYSTAYMIELERNLVNAECEHSCESFVHIQKSSLHLESLEIAKVIDIHSDLLSLSPVVSDSVLSLCGKTSVCMLVEDKEGVVSYIERSVEIDFKPQLSRTFDRVLLKNAEIRSLSFRLVDDSTVEIRAELKAELLLCDVISANPVVGAIALEDKPLEKDDCSLILYFADKGESTWDIAKAYATRESLLMSENSLEESVLDCGKMLLVPTE
ncbi:MAG: DUF3794 domain-containing protein [Ruminococcus sp.]|nr:DUF3794 domain-containing protein [Ruminococcus sp.]